MRRRRPVLLLAGCALAALALTGCGGPGSAPAVGSAPAATASPSPSGLSAATVKQMQARVDAGQSAADAADTDAATDPNQ